MPKTKPDLSFDFGANVASKRPNFSAKGKKGKTKSFGKGKSSKSSGGGKAGGS